jgi:D-alanine-D-alanine ligase
MKIALLHNVRHHYPDPKDYRHQLEGDFDDPITIKWFIKHLKNLGFEVVPIEADEKAYLKLYKLRKSINLVFNVSEGLHGKDRELQIPAMLEMLKIPYTGSSPLTQGLILDKAKAKEIFIANNIPTPQFQLFENVNDSLNPKIKFPVFVKPVAEGSSMGITNNSIANDEKELRHHVKVILENFHEPALVEPFLNGREFSVAMLGNPPEILPIIEPDHHMLPKKYHNFDSLEVKWFFEDNNINYLACPAKIDKDLEKKIKEICFAVWKALGVRDWCRIDIRCDKQKNPYVLEVNSPPGLTPPESSLSSYFPLAARAVGIDYESLLSRIINTALQRYAK